MKKSDLIAALAARQKLTEKQATEIINIIFDGFIEAMKNGKRIEIRGFGSYSIRDYNSYTGRNPKTGQKTTVGKKKLPFFKVGKELKEMVAKKE